MPAFFRIPFVSVTLALVAFATALPAATLPITSGLMAQYRADSGLYQDTAGTVAATSGTTVALWKKMAGSGAAGDLLQATSGSRPTLLPNRLNGNQALLFDGTNDFLQGVFNYTGSEIDIFIVGTRRDSVANDGFLSISNGASQDWNSNERAVIGYSSSTSALGSFRGSALKSTVAQPAVNQLFTFESRFTGTQNIVKVNGVEGTPVASSGAFNTTNLTVGRRWVDTIYQTIDIGEILIYDRVLSASERSDVEAYLAAQWAPASPPVGVFSGGDAGEGLKLSGHALYAVDFNGTNPAADPLTLGDFTFTNHALTPGVTVNAPTTAYSGNNPDFGSTTADNQLETLMDSSIFRNTGGTMTITLDNLQIGAGYDLQLMFLDQFFNSAGSRSFHIEVNGVRIRSNFDINAVTGGWVGLSAPAFGAVVDYRFLATSNQAVINLIGVTNNPIISALTLQAVVPEPSSLVLLGFGAAVAFVGCRRPIRRGRQANRKAS